MTIRNKKGDMYEIYITDWIKFKELIVECNYNPIAAPLKLKTRLWN